MKQRYYIMLVIIILFCFSGANAVPQLINYQGKLSSKTGTPVSGTVSMVFSMYTVTIGGAPVWTETQSVSVNRGIYNVLLGSATPLPASVFDNSSLYLGVKAGTDPEMIPRQQLSSVPFAIKAATAESVPASAITNTQIAAGAQIEFSKLNHPDSDHATLSPYGHTHAGDVITSGTVSTSRLSVGTSAGSVAAGDHNHDSVYQNSFFMQYSAKFTGVYCENQVGGLSPASSNYDGMIAVYTGLSAGYYVMTCTGINQNGLLKKFNTPGNSLFVKMYWTGTIASDHGAYIMTGGSGYSNPTQGYGFHQVGTTLKGIVIDDSQVAYEVDLNIGLEINTTYDLYARLRDSNTIDFYVDGVLKGSLSGIPISATSKAYYYLRAIGNSTVINSMYIVGLYVTQKL